MNCEILVIYAIKWRERGRFCNISIIPPARIRWLPLKIPCMQSLFIYFLLCSNIKNVKNYNISQPQKWQINHKPQKCLYFIELIF